MRTKNYFLFFLLFISYQVNAQFNTTSNLTISGTCSTYPGAIGEYTYGGVENGRPFYSLAENFVCEDLATQETCNAGLSNTYRLRFSGTQWELVLTDQIILDCEWAIFGNRCQPAETPNNVSSSVGTVIATNSATDISPPTGSWTSNEGGCTFSISGGLQLFLTEFNFNAGTNNKARFVEIFNNTNTPVDLTGFQLRSGVTKPVSEGLNTFTFGTDEAAADVDVIVPAYGFLIVGNGATRAEFNTDNGVTLPVSVNYNSGNANIFYVDPDAALSVGLYSSSSIFFHGIGRNSSDLHTYKNIFTNNEVSSATATVTPGALEYALYTNGSFLNSETLDESTGAKDVAIYGDFTLNSNASVNNLNITGSFTVSSGTSLIVNGTSSGTINYTRNLPTSNWYLISSPVVGQDIDAFVSSITGGLQTGTLANNIGLGLTYDSATNTWTYLQSGASGTGNFTSGQGYSINLANASGDITFSGTMLTDNLTPLNLATAGDGFNLVGNPYPSYVNASTLLTDNTGSLDSQTVWVWNQANGVYDAKVTVSNFQVAPAQAFFVKSNGSAGTLSVNESYQSHQSSDTFQRGGNTEVQLTLSKGDTNRDATVYYLNNATKGFDNGLDGELFGGSSYDFVLYSELVSDTDGKKYQIQSVPKSELETIAIPLGIVAKQGETYSISSASFNLPEGITVYLEDTKTNDFTSLNEDTYTFTPAEDLNGAGRFYLHTASKVLSVDDQSIDNIGIFKVNENTLRVTGFENEKVSFTMYSVLGKKMFTTNFEGTNSNDITLENLATGIYIIDLSTSVKKVSKKILID
jgi:hypothetical protein